MRWGGYVAAIRTTPFLIEACRRLGRVRLSLAFPSASVSPRSRAPGSGTVVVRRPRRSTELQRASRAGIEDNRLICAGRQMRIDLSTNRLLPVHQKANPNTVFTCCHDSGREAMGRRLRFAAGERNEGGLLPSRPNLRSDAW